MEAETNLVAYCGLYCGNCRSYTKGKCPGCAKNERAKWCKIRSCCIGNGWSSCAECTIANTQECKKINNFVSKILELIFHSDRPASILYIKEFGAEKYVAKMIETRQMSFRKN
ncbi:MAG: hypothetical protein A2W90_22325 [Bacteroidetes bacterium GWF2_42_66]|nr:MAG: hypothetical protein A2W89_11445 [Bacteroidetes bacterium GWE2_42_39]OFY43649.1 MAG: hypothetical protein A2W90_22325 [Bacteroidetes bacterium GWF2_42_66]HBL75283.1 hypothetical protein [Prolixibacteraceae bacterium]HCR90416.1 hypothetical protein [Prolixibacteraceae bacterium]HCU59743.1 hypothetical protein [Prolixibacteraceae bacterium]